MSSCFSFSFLCFTLSLKLQDSNQCRIRKKRKGVLGKNITHLIPFLVTILSTHCYENSMRRSIFVREAPGGSLRHSLAQSDNLQELSAQFLPSPRRIEKDPPGEDYPLIPPTHTAVWRLSLTCFHTLGRIRCHATLFPFTHHADCFNSFQLKGDCVQIPTPGPVPPPLLHHDKVSPVEC